MRKLFLLVMCLSVLATGVNAFAGKVNLSFYGNKVDNGLVAKNNGEDAVHLFMLIESMGCNGSQVPTGNAKYKLEQGEGKDYFKTANGETVFADSYFWKLSHYNLYVLQPGQRALIQPAPCHGSVTYHKIGRAWVFNNEQWKWLRANCLRVNPNCSWAK